MSAMMREAGLLKELEAAKERIRQLEAQSVAVVGEPVAWLLTRDDDNTFPRAFTYERGADSLVAWYNIAPRIVKHKLIVQPTTSITAAELEAMRKDAARYRWLVSQQYFRSSSPHMDGTFVWCPAGRPIGRGADCNAAIDAALAQGKGE